MKLQDKGGDNQFKNVDLQQQQSTVRKQMAMTESISRAQYIVRRELTIAYMAGGIDSKVRTSF